MKKLNAVMLACGAVLVAALLLAIPLAKDAWKTQNQPSDVFVYSNANTTSSQETAPSAPASATSAPPSYMIRAYEGEIGVFANNEETPFRILDVAVNSLPPTDRMLLQAGIPAHSSSELQHIIEDYES